MRIHFKISDGLVIPSNATPQSAAYDVEATSDPEIVGEQVDGLWKRIDYIQYHTGLFVAPQKDAYQNDYHILVHPKSSVSKYNLQLTNGIGLVDTDYRGEILVRFNYLWQPEDLTLKEVSDVGTVLLGKVNTNKIYKKGDEIVQLIIEPTTIAEWVPVEKLDETVRGQGGFGSTSKIQEKLTPKPSPRVEAPKSAANLAEMWAKEVGAAPSPTSYEKMIREREKQQV